MVGKNLIKLEDVTLRIRDRHVFAGATWEIRRGEHWALTGPNGSGKSTLAGALTGATPVVSGRVKREHQALRVSHLSPESIRSMIAADRRLDATRHFAQRGEPTVAAELLLGGDNGHRRSETRDTDRLRDLSQRFDVGPMLDRRIRDLSSGELKKLLLLRALSAKADLYVLDEPFDGLDSTSRRVFRDVVSELMDGETSFVIITHRIEEILPEVTHVITVGECQITRCERKSDAPASPHPTRFELSTIGVARGPNTNDPRETSPPIVELRNITIKYGERYVFRNFDWRVTRGESWCILGPNGSGKTTLLDLIYGENPLGYANDVRVFGRRRGDGESIWQLRRRLGIVSPYLQTRYDRRLLALDVLVSGFFDSVGLYRIPTKIQMDKARRTAANLGIAHLGDRSFDQLSSGERMLMLIGRAMVKGPDILILDEPCQGLDRDHREEVVRLVESIVRSPVTDVIYVTHLDDEIPESITRVLDLSRIDETNGVG